MQQEYQGAMINSLSHELRGVTTIDGKTTFVFNALPGETVDFKYTNCHRQFDEGTALNISNPSPLRTPPQCQHYGVCGGCRLQHMTHEAQINQKERMFVELLQHQANTTPNTLLPAITSNPWGYRTKARLSVRHVPKKEKVLVGFREQNGRYVADILSCAILHPQVGEKINDMSVILNTLDIKDQIPQIEVAVGEDGAALIVRHLSPISENDQIKLINFAKQHHFSLYLQPKGPDTIQKIYPNNQQDLLHYDLPEFNLRLFFHPSEFTQINTAINRQMIEQAIKLLEPGKEEDVLDLFCGIGNFSLPLAQKCNSVTGVEGSDQAVQRAQQNAKFNHLENCEFYSLDLTQDCTEESWAKRKYHKILLDPARAGAKEILAYIPLWTPERIVYVSCNPMTLARDTKILLDLGYTLDKAGVMDMFPHTQHIEAMALFVRNPNEANHR